MIVENASQAQEELERWRKEFPGANPAYKPSGKTTLVGIVAMVLGTPFAGIAALVVAAVASLITALVLGLFSGLIMWFARRLPGLSSLADSHIKPGLIYLCITALILAGAMACGMMMGKLVAALGRYGKNRNAYVIGTFAAIGTFLVLFCGVWLGNMEHNPQMPEILQEWPGKIVGLFYAGIGAGVAAKTGFASAAGQEFCEDCKIFMTPQAWRVTQQSLSAIRVCLMSSEPCDPAQVRTSNNDSGRVRLVTCPTCKCGFLDLDVHFSATWKERETPQSLSLTWLTASKRLNGGESQYWIEMLSQAKNDSSRDQGDMPDGESSTTASSAMGCSSSYETDAPLHPEYQPRFYCNKCNIAISQSTHESQEGRCERCFRGGEV